MTKHSCPHCGALREPDHPCTRDDPAPAPSRGLRLECDGCATELPPNTTVWIYRHSNGDRGWDPGVRPYSIRYQVAPEGGRSDRLKRVA